MRALLANQVQNDAGPTDATVVCEDCRTWDGQARKDLGHPELAVLVNRQTPHPNRTAIRQAQERMIHEVTHCFPRPDYDQLADEDRYDRIHLSATGAEKAAHLWAAAADAEFFSRSIPYQPR